MLEIVIPTLISLVLVILVIMLIILFNKHLKFIHTSMEEIRREQTVLYKEVVESKSNLMNSPKDDLLKYLISNQNTLLKYSIESLVSCKVESIESNVQLNSQSVKMAEEQNNNQSVKITEVNAYDPKNQVELRSNENIKQQLNLNTPPLKSSQVSRKQLLELIRDKELVSEGQVTIQPESLITDLDIEIKGKNSTP